MSLTTEKENVLPRRLFLTRGLQAAGTALLGAAFGGSFVVTEAKDNLNLSALKLKYNFKGTAFRPSDSEFSKAVYGGLWNELYPNRKPQLILQVADEEDVVAAVNYARDHKLKIAVRGGGHNWCAPSVRNHGVLIDLTKLNRVISIDPVGRKAVVQPIVSNREVQAHINAHDLAYPSGHCPPVKLSGYLLSGGMSWNQGVWGHGAGSVEAIEMVTPGGEKILASDKQHQDYFWAARGGGSGLFAVCTRYHLKLYPLPKAIHATTYFYPYENLTEVATWLSPLAAQLPAMVELSLFILQAPPELADQCKSSNGKVCLVAATVFADNADQAAAAVAPLDTCPVLNKCLKKTINEPTNFEKLFDASGSLWPGNLRCKVDALFSDAPAQDLFSAVQKHYLSASPKSIVMFALFTGGKTAPGFDGAFSMDSKLYGGPWTMWDKAQDDQENIAWHNTCVDLLKPHINGYYVGETNTAAHPEYARAAFKEPNWRRLEALRTKHDPQGVFFNFSEGLA